MMRDDQAQEDALVLTPDQETNVEEFFRRQQEEHGRKYAQFKQQARAVSRALEGWVTVPDADAWVAICEESKREYESGRFFIERLGAERQLDPRLMATLWGLRQQLLNDAGAETAAEQMLADLTMLAYANALRVQGWIGDLALWVERELFVGESLTAKLRQQYGAGSVQGFAVEERLERLTQHLVPRVGTLHLGTGPSSAATAMT